MHKLLTTRQLYTASDIYTHSTHIRCCPENRGLTPTLHRPLHNHHRMPESAPTDNFEHLLAAVTAQVLERHRTLDTLPVTPAPEAVRRTTAALPATLPAKGRGSGATIQYLQDEILTGCLTAQSGPRYFGFVTGGVTEAAQLADILGSSYDENVQVTLPDTSAATAIESRTLEMVLDLLGIQRETFQGRTITTGATASNILGLGECRGDSDNSVCP